MQNKEELIFDGFIYANANLNNDDKISLGDILMIVDIILKQ